MKYEYLVFDLDGTISDPKDGIVRSLNYALENHGFSIRDENELVRHIGPPLDQTFSVLTNESGDELISSLIAKYRERYSDIGFSENVLYKGIEETLQQLNIQPGIKLGVCTSKRVDFAERILTMFGLRELFDFVNGGKIGIEKWQQLASLYSNDIINSRTVMIGDRFVDLIAAHKNGLHAAGVLWGFGSQSELEQHEPTHIFKRPCELVKLTTYCFSC